MNQKYPDKKVQIWYQDEARFGQKGIVTKIWTIEGTRPTLPRQNGFKSSYFIGAVCPETGKKHALLFDGLDSRVVNIFLDDFSKTLSRNVHVVMVMDGAGWHKAEDLIVPKNISLLPLPPYSPELNPIDQIWDYLKSNFLSRRIFSVIEDIFDYGVKAWRELKETIIKSICAGAPI
jgi:transposase